LIMHYTDDAKASTNIPITCLGGPSRHDKNLEVNFGWMGR